MSSAGSLAKGEAGTPLATATRALLLADNLGAAAVPSDTGSRGTTVSGAGMSGAGSLAKAEAGTPLSIATGALLMEDIAVAAWGDRGSRVTTVSGAGTSGAGSSAKAEAGRPASTIRRPGGRQIASSSAASIWAASSIIKAPLAGHHRTRSARGTKNDTARPRSRSPAMSSRRKVPLTPGGPNTTTMPGISSAASARCWAWRQSACSTNSPTRTITPL